MVVKVAIMLNKLSFQQIITYAKKTAFTVNVKLSVPEIR